MDRLQAKLMFKNDKDSYGKPRAIMTKLDKIFDELESDILDFAEWMNIEAIRTDEHEWKYRGDNYKKRYSTEALFVIWKSELFECPKCHEITAKVVAGGTIKAEGKRNYDMDVSHNFCNNCGHDWWD